MPRDASVGADISRVIVDLPVRGHSGNDVAYASAPEKGAVGLASYRTCVRNLNGFTLRDTTFGGAQCLALEAPACDQMRLAVTVEAVSGRLMCRPHPQRVQYDKKGLSPISFLPANMQAWACSDSGGEFRVVTLAFDAHTLEKTLHEPVAASWWQAPRLNFFNERLHWLARSLANENQTPDRFSLSYSSGLIPLVAVELARELASERESTPRKGGLSRAQLARVLEYMESSVAASIRLSELAELSGFSVSHFCHAFRASTGVTPYRWQLDNRIRKAQQLLLRGQAIASVAEAMGFSDQSHFTRVFRRAVGAAPRSWLKSVAAAQLGS